MRKYADDLEQRIRVRRQVDEWARSGLIDAAQHQRIAADVRVDLRRTNRFLRLTLLGFGLLIVAASVGLVVVTLELNDGAAVGLICLVAAAVCAVAADYLIDRFRLYRFGVEEALAIGAAALVAIASASIGSSARHLGFNGLLAIALVVGSAAAFLIYRRFGYWYAAVAAMACAGLAPFQFDLSAVSQRLLAGAVLAGCFAAARLKRRQYGDDFPGDDYALIQAAAAIGVYAALNVHLWAVFSSRPQPAPFYWFTYVMIWAWPAAALRLSIRDRDRPLLDASLAMALATLVTNKPYLHLARKPWDPALLGLLLVGGAIVLRRWLAAGADGSRQGFTAARILRSDNDKLAAAGTASAAFGHATAHRHPDPGPPDPFEGGGGRSGGGGAGASY